MNNKNVKNIDLPEELFLSLLQGYAMAKKWASSLIEKQGITLSEYHLLRIVWNEKQTTARIIQERLSSSAPTITQMVSQLEIKELIQRTQDASDKRLQHITLTSSGKKVMSKARNEIKKETTKLALPTGLFRQAIESIEIISSALSSSQHNYEIK